MNDLASISEAIRAGSEPAFEALFRTEFRNVSFFVLRFVHDQEQAEDIAQESFMALWKNRESLDPGRSIRNYILTIARNRALNWLRDCASRQGLPGVLPARLRCPTWSSATTSTRTAVLIS